MVHQRQNFGLADRPSDRQIPAGGAANPGVRARACEPDQQRARRRAGTSTSSRTLPCCSNAMRSTCSKTGATAEDRALKRISPRSAACRSSTSRNMRPMRAACEQLARALLRFTEAMRSCNSAIRRYLAVMPKQRHKTLRGNRTRKTKKLTRLQRRRKRQIKPLKNKRL